jgi:mRNA-degrading endonuclease RelE of RelBE toxin-antitoxin system
MPFKLLFTERANQNLDALEQNNALVKRLKAVRKALAYLETNPRHPSLNTHKYESISGSHGEEVFEAYVENNTPGAYRIFWYYGPGKNTITILAITPHP